MLAASLRKRSTTAKALVAPLYRALVTPDPNEVVPLLDQATSADWLDCGANDRCETKAEAAGRWMKRGEVVPDLQWREVELLVSGSSIVVRGESTGTPAGPFLGVAPTGQTFRVMTIDIHETRGGKIVRTHHLEDWLGAVRQLTTPRRSKEAT